MSSAPSCPTPEQLEDLVANRLTTGQADTIRQHVAGCTKCQARTQTGKTTSSRAYPFLSPPRGPDELGWLDEHRILGVLGEGGMSIVFDAEDANLHRRVALKVLRPHICNATTRERFLREGRLLASLPHDHIVTIYQVGEVNEIPYLTMERLEGTSLEKRLERDHWLPVAEAITYTREAAEGLVFAHDAGLVHRDIKPANIWLEMRHGRFRRIKLIDFGIARQLNSDATLTSAGQVLGTPMYMAPEQAAGKPVDGRADLYSLGCVLFHMLTGRPPFDGGEPTTMALLQRVIAGEAPQVQKTAPQIPTRVAELIQQMLSREPAERPANARVLVEKLKQLEGEDLSAAPPPPTRVAHGSLIRRPAMLGILLGIVAILAALIVSGVAIYNRVRPAGHANGSSSGGDKGPSGPPFKLGLLHSETGSLSIHELPMIRATELAVEEINKAGGVLGRTIEITLEDGASDEEEFARKAKKLVDVDKVDVLFGCWTSSSRKRVAEVCRQHDRLLFYSTLHEGLENSPNVVYLGGTPNQTFIPLVRWAYAEKKKRRFFLVGSDAIFSHCIHAILKEEITQLGGTVVGENFTSFGESEFKPVVATIKKANADILISTVDGLANVTLFRALRNAGIQSAMMPTVWATLSEAELSSFRSEQIVGDYTVACYFENLPGEANRIFIERYRQRHGASERVSDAMETAYFGVFLWKKAVEKAGSADIEAIRRALGGLTVDSPEGPIQLASNQHAYRTTRIGEIVEGKRRAQFRLVYSSPEPVLPEPFPKSRTEQEWKQLLDGLYEKWGKKWSNPR